MSNPKYNKDKHFNVKLGEFYDSRILREEADTLNAKEEQNLELVTIMESVQKISKAEQETKKKLFQKQKYLNESNYFALKHYVTKLAINQAKGLYDFESIREEMEIDPEELIADEVEEQLTVEIPLELQGQMGTVIPIKIETTPETADVVQAVIGLMDQTNGEHKNYLDTEQIEQSAIDAVEQLPEDTPQFQTASEEIADDTVDIISKDQQIISGIKAKMDEIELRVAGTEEILSDLGEFPEQEEQVYPGSDKNKLVTDPETGLLIDPETGDVYDPETGEILKEDYHREHEVHSILETLAIKKGIKMINENHESYNRDVAIIQGVNSLIVRKTFDHIFGRKQSYAEMKRELRIK